MADGNYKPFPTDEDTEITYDDSDDSSSHAVDNHDNDSSITTMPAMNEPEDDPMTSDDDSGMNDAVDDSIGDETDADADEDYSVDNDSMMPMAKTEPEKYQALLEK